MLDREGGKGSNKIIIGFSKYSINMKLSVRIVLKFQRDFFFTKEKKKKKKKKELLLMLLTPTASRKF